MLHEEPCPLPPILSSRLVHPSCRLVDGLKLRRTKPFLGRGQRHFESAAQRLHRTRLPERNRLSFDMQMGS